MPLLDHFHPPLSRHRHWTSFLHTWGVTIAGDLNRRLPPDYLAQTRIQFNIRVDRTTLRDSDRNWRDDLERAGPLWEPPAPGATIPFATALDEVEVTVHDTVGGLTPVGVIALASPANKDQPAGRAAFTAKSETYLRDGLGLVVIDIVTDPPADLAAGLMRRLQPGSGRAIDASLAVVAYRPGPADLEIWPHPLQVGGALPTVPLWLRGGPCLPLDLEATYREARRGLKLDED